MKMFKLAGKCKASMNFSLIFNLHTDFGKDRMKHVFLSTKYGVHIVTK